MIANHPLIGRRVRVMQGNRQMLMQGQEYTVTEVWDLGGTLCYQLNKWSGHLFGSWRFELIQDP